MHVSMLVRRRVALLAVLAAAAACSDAPTTTPRQAERAPFDIASLQPADSRWGTPNGNSAFSDSGGNENVATFTVNPNFPWTYTFGQHWIYFPAHSICDPATSGYGPTLWDTPCTPLAKPIQVTVHWSTKGGLAYASFSPELRFVPAGDNDFAHWVILSLHDRQRLNQSDVYTVLYDAAGSEGWVDESLTDPTLHAWLDIFHNSVVRRVKHFSGYLLNGNWGMGGMDDASY